MKDINMNELVLLKMTSHKEDNGEVTIRAITPMSTVELTSSEEIALQVFKQLGQRLLTTLESELENLKEDMESNSDSYALE